MKKSIAFIIVFFAILGCDIPLFIPTPQRDLPYFKILNKSSDDLEWVRIYVGDAKIGEPYTKNIKLVQISEKNELKSGRETDRYAVKLRDFSKEGTGYFCVYAKKKGAIDTLSRAPFRIYTNFDFTDDSYPGYNTFEIEVFDKNPPNPEIQTVFARYNKKNVKLEDSTGWRK